MLHHFRTNLEYTKWEADPQLDPGRWVILIDFDGFVLSDVAGMKMLKRMGEIFGLMPERLGKCVLIDAPWVFGSTWTILKSWMVREYI